MASELLVGEQDQLYFVHNCTMIFVDDKGGGGGGALKIPLSRRECLLSEISKLLNAFLLRRFSMLRISSYAQLAFSFVKAAT